MPEFDFDPVPTTPYRRPAVDDDEDVEEGFGERPATHGREGLPPTFRMRHSSHYVEQLMGETPLQTVRQVPVSQIDGENSGPEPPADLIASVQELGVLQPLLVAAEGRRYSLVAGEQRFAAARLAGLTAVPCLVLTGDAALQRKWRAATAGRRRDVPLDSAAPSAPDLAPGLSAAFAEIGSTLAFVKAMVPFASGHDASLRPRVLTELMGIETERATALAAAAGWLVRAEPARREEVDAAAHLQALRGRIAPDAQYRGVEVAWPETALRPLADPEALAAGWAAMLHALLALSRHGSRLDLTLQVTRIRPALMFTGVLSGVAPLPPVEDLLDHARPSHPGGPSCPLFLSGAARIARLLGGRLALSSTDGGFSASIVVPQ